jgi:adenine-specific DNA-methyltransferase
MFQSMLPLNDPRPSPALEAKGVVYTKSWVVDLLLELAGYSAQSNLVDAIAVEPAAGEGAFLVPMAVRLVASCLRQARPLADCESSLIAYELDGNSAKIARNAVAVALHTYGISQKDAERLADIWIRCGDYLEEAARLPGTDFVVGNPPYVRLEDIPAENASLYRKTYQTMRGRADLYVAFFEAALRQLTKGGRCATVIEMHNADPFMDDVSAYPAITIIRRGEQRRAIVASAGPGIDQSTGSELASALRSSVDGRQKDFPAGLVATVVESWFTGSDPWPCNPPARLALIRRLEEQFEPLESDSTGTKVGIGVATGLDKVFITRDGHLVESTRLLPLAMAEDTVSGHFRWSGHYLVNPWETDGLVDLKNFPRLKNYLDNAQIQIKKRNTAQRNPGGWYRTIDRVHTSLTKQRKLYIPDIKNTLNPVLENGETYPHHNLYFILSDRWDLEVLGGLLLSSIGQLFVESYGVRIRGGYLRFQAQYLRRIRVPKPEMIAASQAQRLASAFRKRDRQLASAVALEIYRVDLSEIESGHQH